MKMLTLGTNGQEALILCLACFGTFELDGSWGVNLAKHPQDPSKDVAECPHCGNLDISEQELRGIPG